MDEPVLVAEHRREGVTVLAAGFNDFSRKALSNFKRFGNAAALSYEPWNIRACSEIAAILEVFNANADSHFLNFRQMFLPSH